MQKQLLIFVSLLPVCAQAFTPRLRVYNGTDQEIIGAIWDKDGKTSVKYEAAPERYSSIFTGNEAQKIKMVSVGSRVALTDLHNNRSYQELVAQATERKQHLCVTIKRIDPIEVSEITLCPSTQETPVPRAFTPQLRVYNGTGKSFEGLYLDKDRNTISQYDARPNGYADFVAGNDANKIEMITVG